MAVGTSDGHMIVLTEDSGTHVTTVRMCGAGINGIKYNLDGDLVAGASQNGSIYIYKVSNHCLPLHIKNFNFNVSRFLGMDLPTRNIQKYLEDKV